MSETKDNVTDQSPPGEPAANEPEDARPAPRKARKIHRLRISANVGLQIFLLAVLVFIANYLGARHFERWDLSRGQKYSLSEKTTSLLEELEEPVEIIIRLRATSRIADDVGDLIREMQFIAGDNLQVETMNPELDISREQELQADYAFRQGSDLVLVRNPRNDQHRFVYENEMIELAPLDPYQAMADQKAEPDIAAFTGEQKIVSALIEVLEERQPKVYFTQGHNEVAIGEESPASLFLEALAQENVVAEELRLAAIEGVPDDAAAVVIASPKYDFTLKEVQALEDYWAGGGRILMLLDPNMWTTNLESFAKRRAIEPRGDRILRTLQLEGVNVIVPQVMTQFPPDSIMTQGLEDANAMLKGHTQSLGMSAELARELELELSGLMFATEGYWGETQPEAEVVEFQEDQDYAFPLAVAAAVEPTSDSDQQPRAVIIGNGAIIQNEAAKNVTEDFMLNVMNWLLDRDYLIGIPPRERNLAMLTLTPEQKGRIWFYCVVLVPLVPAGAGIIIWLKRRR